MATHPHQECIYLDYNATTPIWEEVADAMKPFLIEFGNPSSNHPYGRACNAAVTKARAQIAGLLGAQPDEIYFCSCGTEADNWAIWGSVAAARRRHPGVTPHVVTSAVEHPAILEHLSSLHELGLLEYTAVGVNSEGIVDPKSVEEAITDATCLITIMHANNEVGSIQPIPQIAEIARQRDILMHTDAAQSAGKVDVLVNELGVDMCTIVGHKLGAPKGVAVLYIRDGTELDRMLCGGGQERGRRAGTENVLLAVGMGKAAEIATNELKKTQKQMMELRDELQRLLLEGLSTIIDNKKVHVNGPTDPSLRLPNTLSISIEGIVGATLLGGLSEEVAASAGAACHSSGAPSVSGVLWAMGVPHDLALGTLRLSVGRYTTMEEVHKAAELIIAACKGSS